jgi:glutamyl-tRNA(Gln) amidotransferase subunit D
MSRALDLKPNFCKDVVLIKFYPGMPSSILEWVLESDFKGVVIEGTGLGHVSELQYEPIKKLIMKGIPVVMTSQCIWGRVHMNVYSTGRDLLRIGVIPAEDMLPETALVKMMWALGQTSDPREVEKIMKTNLAHEITLRRTYNGSFNE